MIIDTHSHIYDSAFDEDRAEVISRAKESGVGHIVLSNVDSETIAPMNSLYNSDTSYFSMGMGLHPTSVTPDFEQSLQQVRQELERGVYSAVGEVGIDLYWDTQYKALQIEAFRKQIDMALEFNLPIVIHTRKAFAEVFSVLDSYRREPLRGVFHCFGGGVEEAKKALSMGFHLGIGGVVTYKNSHLGEILKVVGITGLLLETDAPYLSPVPYRGKRNEPSYLVEVCDKLSELFHISSCQVSEITSSNSKLLFNIV